MLIAKATSTLEVTITPFLLESKKFVLERLQRLGVENVEDIASVREEMIAERAVLIAKQEVRERRWRLMQSVVQREFIATAVGGLLLFILSLALIVAMFAGVPATEVVKNSFLVILGYFFGQVSGASRSGE